MYIYIHAILWTFESIQLQYLSTFQHTQVLYFVHKCPLSLTFLCVQNGGKWKVFHTPLFCPGSLSHALVAMRSGWHCYAECVVVDSNRVVVVFLSFCHPCLSCCWLFLHTIWASCVAGPSYQAGLAGWTGKSKLVYGGCNYSKLVKITHLSRMVTILSSFFSNELF